MSVVTVQLGQCGNQIGTDLFNLLMNDATEVPKYSSTESNLNKEYHQDVLERFFTINDSRRGRSEKEFVAKSVLVDTELKVINQCIAQSEKFGKWSFPKDSNFSKKQGSGNNWAQGYEGYGKEASESILNLARREVEQCDWFSGFLVMMSLAGGTGSGLGTYITHCLHDTFQDSFIVNQVIWPYSTGEVILQNYNTVLSLSHLYQSSDGIIIFQNDHLNKICTRLLSLKDVSFDDVNKVICHKLASVLQPAFSANNSLTSNVLGNILSDLCSHPAYKLLSVKNIPQMSEKSMDYTTFVWPALMKHLRQMLIADSALEEGIDWEIKVPPASSVRESTSQASLKSNFNKSVANALILRGKECQDVTTTDFGDKNIYARWVSENKRLSVWQQQRPFNKYEKSATLLSNGQSFVEPLNSVVKKAWNMFASRAYVHQYTRYGLSDDDFVDSFGYLEQILSDYQHL